MHSEGRGVSPTGRRAPGVPRRQPTTPGPGPSREHARASARLVVVGAVLLLGACNPRLEAPTQTISGVLVLDQGTPVERGGGECRGTGGYSDLRSGLETVATDASGNVLATGRLTAAPPATDAAGEVPAAERRRCVYTFTLQNLPELPSYGVGIGERGAITYTREELEAQDWTVTVSLGG